MNSVSCWDTREPTIGRPVALMARVRNTCRWAKCCCCCCCVPSEGKAVALLGSLVTFPALSVCIATAGLLLLQDIEVQHYAPFSEPSGLQWNSYIINNTKNVKCSKETAYLALSYSLCVAMTSTNGYLGRQNRASVPICGEFTDRSDRLLLESPLTCPLTPIKFSMNQGSRAELASPHDRNLI